MLDQNTTTIITSALTVIGALGGVVLGVVLSNRYTFKQDKTKRNTPIIEEAYTLLIKIDSLCMHNINENRLFNNGIRDDLNRLRTLVSLYLPSVKYKLGDFVAAVLNLTADIYEADDEKKVNVDAVFDNITEPFTHYNACTNAIFEALEKLVR